MTHPMTPAQREVVDRLTQAGAGRGVVELAGAVPLAGRGGVDTDHVDDRELLRVCVSTLAHLARQLPPEPPPTPPRVRWFRRARPPEHVRAPLDELVGAVWQARVRAGSGMRWRRVWDTAHARGRPLRPTVTGPLSLDPVGTDLLRRLNQALGSAPAPVRAGAHRVVGHRPGVPLGVPRPHLAWAVAQAERDGLVVPSTDPTVPRRVPVAATLARAIEELSSRG